MSRYSTPIADLITRLKYHAATGQSPKRLLDGVTIKELPKLEIEGDADLPNIRIFVPDLQEHFSGGRNLDGKVQIKLIIANQRELGTTSAMQLLEKVLDAIQIDTNGQIDSLAGIARHFDAEVKDAYPSDRAINMPLILHLQPFKHEAGKRH